MINCQANISFNFKCKIRMRTISPFGGGWGEEKQPRILPLAPPKQGWLVLNEKSFSSKYNFVTSPNGTTYYNNGCQPIALNKSTSPALKGRYNLKFRPFRAKWYLEFLSWGWHPKLVKFTPSGLSNKIKFVRNSEPITPTSKGGKYIVLSF